jgi:LmbE family N-acetylglucosaminyl deacetylase
MATFVFFHAHPDDEVLSTGGTIARAASEGHRVVLVVATNGEYGEVPDDLAEGETLIDRRRAETAASAGVLGVDRIEWLGYRDSGMTGWAQNDDPASFLQADVDEAAERLAAVLRAEQADVLSIYDWHGNYGHPDHIRVHQVGHRAGELAGTAKVVEATINRDHLKRLQAMFAEMVAASGERPGVNREEVESGAEPPADEFDPDAPADDGNPLGMLEHEITLAVDITPYLDQKRRALLAHKSQVTDTGFFLQMPDDAFARSFGTEWFIEKDVPAGGGPRQGWLVEK